MNLTIREGVNKDSIVLQHKIALETITLLEDKDLVLNTELRLYAMVSTVDNFIEENLIEVVGNDERTFAELVETEIEPKFHEIVDKYEYAGLFEEVVEICREYLDMKEYKDNTFIGLIDTLLDVLSSQNWDDLKFFFNDVIVKAKEQVNKAVSSEEKTKEPLTGAKRILAKEQYNGASDKMAALIEKFQREGQELKNERKIQEEIKVEESNE